MIKAKTVGAVHTHTHTHTSSSIKQDKGRKGVTLLALVITIAILAILAGVSVTVITGDEGLINNAKKVAEDTEKAKDKTSQDLKDLADELGEVAGWIQQEDGSIKKGKTILHIGDYVNYDCTVNSTTYKSPYSKTGYWSSYETDEDETYQTFNASNYEYGWRVMGVDDDGQLLLLAENNVDPISGGYYYSENDRNWYALSGKEGYANGKQELDNISAIYGYGKGAVGARSITADDINKITGYNPETDSTTYGKKFTYSYTDSGITCTDSSNNTSKVGSSYQYYDEVSKKWKMLDSSNTSYVSTYTAYIYTPTLSKDSAAYKMLFVDKITTSSKHIYACGYWLANSFVISGTDRKFVWVYGGI